MLYVILNMFQTLQAMHLEMELYLSETVLWRRGKLTQATFEL